MAKLYFRYGAMNSGKTALLLQACFNYEERGMHVFVMKSLIDEKGGDMIVSRIGLERKVDHLIKDDEDLFSYYNKINKKYDCIFVDEAQFLSREQVDQLMRIVVEKDTPVICYGLRTDFLTKGFSGSTRLLEIAHSIEEMKTICGCGSKAIFNARFKNGEIVVEGESTLIDLENDGITYEAMCPKCYYKRLKNRD